MKKIFKTKTVWAGIGSIVIGIGTLLTGGITDGTQLRMGGLVAIFLRDAIEKKAPEATK